MFSGGLAQKLERLRVLIMARLAGEYRVCRATEDTLIGLMALALVIDGRELSLAAALESLRNQEQALVEEQP